MQLALDLPGDVGEEKHRNRDVADVDGGVEFLAFAYSSNEVREVRVRHGIAPDQVSDGSRDARLDFAFLIPLEVINLVAAAIDERRALRAHDRRTAIAAVKFHPLATLALPRNHLVFICEAGHQRVVKLPVVFEVVSTA